MRFCCFLSLFSILALSPSAFAQNATDYSEGLSERIQRRIVALEKGYEAEQKAFAKDFRLVREVEAFDPIGKRTMDVEVDLSEDSLDTLKRPGSPPAIATLHDRRTGAPLDSCKLPCTLQSPRIPPGMVVIYRYGSKPANIPSEQLTYLDTGMPFWLRFNEVDHQINRDRCAAESEERLAKGEDADADPCVRVPPEMPSQAERSGHCTTTFDVSDIGEPINLIVDSCTDPIFCEPSQESIDRWIYHPKIYKGQHVRRVGVESKVSFRLMDELGEIIPEPEDEMQPCIGTV